MSRSNNNRTRYVVGCVCSFVDYIARHYSTDTRLIDDLKHEVIIMATKDILTKWTWRRPRTDLTNRATLCCWCVEGGGANMILTNSDVCILTDVTDWHPTTVYKVYKTVTAFRCRRFNCHFKLMNQLLQETSTASTICTLHRSQRRYKLVHLQSEVTNSLSNRTTVNWVTTQNLFYGNTVIWTKF